MQLNWPSATSAPNLADNEAHAWAVPLVAGDAARQALSSTLSAAERQRADEFRFDHLRQRFVIAHGALRKVLSCYLDRQPQDVTFALDDRGKPCLDAACAPSQLNFNLSHSDDLALILVAKNCEIGVDVEHVRDVSRMEQIAQRFFHPAEADAVLTTPAYARNDAFLRCWTAKEAVLKAYGTGIAASLDAFQVPLAESHTGWVDLSALPSSDRGSRCWLQRLSPCNEYVAAAAFMGSERLVRCFAFSA
jgi:4'-phosphopantetheinyl transferase